MLHCQANCRHIHNFQVLFHNFFVRQLRIKLGVFVQLRIFVVHAADFSRFHQNISADFQRSQRGRRVGGKIRIACACGKNHHSAFLKMANSSLASVTFRDSWHFNRTLDSRIHAFFFESVFQRQRVHNGRQHSHIVRSRSVYPFFG